MGVAHSSDSHSRSYRGKRFFLGRKKTSVLPKPVSHTTLVTPVVPSTGPVQTTQTEEQTKETAEPISFSFIPPLVIDENSICLNDEDSMSRTALDVAYLILVQLSTTDLCSLQQLNKTWYLIIGSNNKLWREVVIRECQNWVGKEKILKLAEGSGELVHWKSVCRDFRMMRKCARCSATFRNYSNHATCRAHSGIRDLVHNGFGPSGVKWTCCGEISKEAKGCVFNSHVETL